jgi:hypothetical protein
MEVGEGGGLSVKRTEGREVQFGEYSEGREARRTTLCLRGFQAERGEGKGERGCEGKVGR